MPNMDEIEEQKVYRFNLTKAWFASIVANAFRISQMSTGNGQFQLDLKKIDEAETSPSYNVDLLDQYRVAVEIALYALPVAAIIL